MTFHSLADELDGAFDDPMEQAGRVGEEEGLGRSLAEEFEMNDDSPPTTPSRPRNVFATPPSLSPVRTKRSKKSSASSYHTAHPSFSSSTFLPQSPGTNDRLPFEGQLEASMELLDSMDEVDQSLYVDERNFPWDGSPTLERQEVQEDRRDPLVLLGEHMVSANRLLEKLKKGDCETVEESLQGHLATMGNAARTREEQLRRVGEVAREMDQMGVAAHPPSRTRCDHLPPHIKEGRDEEADIGWTTVECPGEQGEGGEYGENTQPQPTTPLLPSLTRELADSSLPLDLAHFSDSIHNALSEHTSIARQLRAIRAAVEGHREREAAEAAAIEGLERWDRTRMERGLRGEDDTATLLRREVDEFREMLNECGRRMENIVMKSAGLSG